MQPKLKALNERMFPIYRCVIFWAFFMGLLFIFGSFIVPLFPKPWASMVYGITGTFAALIATFTFLKHERKTFADVWLTFESLTILKFLAGFVGGTILGAIMFSMLVAFTDLRFHKNPLAINGWAIMDYLAFLPLGLMEEIGFRGYSFVSLHRKYDLRITQFIVAIAFALYHIIGGQEVIGSFLGPGVWAYVFGYAAIRSRGIALPLGIHMALNVIQSVGGMKGTANAIWLIDFKGVPTAAMIQQARTCGTIMHVVLLVIGVLLTELYLRKTRYRPITGIRVDDSPRLQPSN
jgi:CAAX protease family protein